MESTPPLMASKYRPVGGNLRRNSVSFSDVKSATGREKTRLMGFAVTPEIHKALVSSSKQRRHLDLPQFG